MPLQDARRCRAALFSHRSACFVARPAATPGAVAAAARAALHRHTRGAALVSTSQAHLLCARQSDVLTHLCAPQAEAFALRYLSQAEVLSSLAWTSSPALAFLSAVVLWGSGAVLYVLLCCGLHVRLRFQIHVCLALLVVLQLLAPAFYEPALASNASLQRIAGIATALGRRTAPRDACLALWRFKLLAAFWVCVAALYRMELKSRKRFLRRAVFHGEPPGCSPRSLVRPQCVNAAGLLVY